MKRERTEEEYEAQAMLLGEDWYYDDVDHTMNYSEDDNYTSVECYDADTMEFLYTTDQWDEAAARKSSERRKRYARYD